MISMNISPPRATADEEGRQRAERERADAEQRQAEHRVARRALDHDEGDQQQRPRRRQQRDHPRAAPAGRVRRRRAGSRR